MSTSQPANANEEHAVEKTIFDEVAATAKQLGGEPYASSYKARAMRDLAFAVRLATGGPQPGSVEFVAAK